MAEATQISKLARVVVENCIIIIQKPYLAEQGINTLFLMQMQELGVISGVETHGLLKQCEAALTQIRFEGALRSNGKALLIVEHDDPNIAFDLPVYKLTNIGTELMGLNKVEPDINYLRLVGKQIAALGFTVCLGKYQADLESGANFEVEERFDP